MQSIAGITSDLHHIADQSSELERNGADMVSAIELCHDPLIQLALAGAATKNCKLMTSITVAFARSPMTLALQAHDVNSLSSGRLMLGIGSQIKPHIENRYSMEWSKPAARMREYVMALKAIWACWYEGEQLNFQGEFYRHTLMTPMFTPDDGDNGAPSVLVAAVGPLMTESAAEVADGILLHTFTTEEYIRTVTLPSLRSGLAKADRSYDDIQLVGNPIFVTGETEEEFNSVKQAACQQIAFYASTPAYKPVLESVGYDALQPELHVLSKAGRWAEMGRQIDDTLLDQIAIVGDLQEIQEKLERRFADIFDACTSSVFAGSGYREGYFHQGISEIMKSM